jgi:hypothetical protein
VNDRFSRRTFVTGTAGLAASLTVPVVASADDEIRIPDSSAGIAERLGAVAGGLGQVGARLDRIDAVLINPPDPDKPAIRDALTTITAEAAGIVVTADDMLRRV